ncbi:type IV secretion system protein, partial [Bartonella mastomydis]|uniref:type IV secretion system protein n=1 Tax=Bartonella mastomydis TaxID=1820002 RepID=UPI002482BF7B
SPTVTPPPPTPSTPPTPPAEYLEVIQLLKKKLELKEKQFSAIEDAYKAITDGSITTHQDAKTTKEMYDKLFLKDVGSLHAKNYSNALYQKILQDEERVAEKRHMLNGHILGRLRYTSTMDRAITLHALDASENRFKYILSLLDTLERAKNLKEIADFQANMDGILAMIENESVKLQIVVQLRDAEYALIKMHRHELDLKAFDIANTKMPTIKFQ